MIERRRGHLVNIGSLASYIGVGWYAPYSAAKHGNLGLIQALRFEHAASLRDELREARRELAMAQAAG